MRRLLVISSWFMVFLVFFLGNISPVYSAEEATKSSSISQKLEELKKDIASKAAVLKKEISNKLENRAYVGVIKQKSSNSITMATPNGTKIVSINQDTVFQGVPKSKKGSFTAETLKAEDSIAALGDVDDTGSLIARKIVQLGSEPKNTKTIIWGEIVSKSADILTIRDKELKNIEVSVLNTTEIKKGQESLKLKDVGINIYVIATGTMNKEKEVDAELIYIVPSEGVKPKNTEASASASPSVSPSPTPKATPKVSASPKSSATPKATPKKN